MCNTTVQRHVYLCSFQCVLRAFGIKQLSDFAKRYCEPCEKKSSHLEAFSADLNDISD